MIEFRDVHASYDGSAPILKGVSFTIRDGEFVAFVGTSGARAPGWTACWTGCSG